MKNSIFIGCSFLLMMFGMSLFAQEASLCEIRSEGYIFNGFTLEPNTTGTKTVSAVTIDGEEYTCAVEIGSSQILSFSITEKKILTLYCNPDQAGKKIKLNDVKYDEGIDEDGTLVIPLEAGSYTIKKQDTFRLIYISLSSDVFTDIEVATSKDPFVYLNNSIIYNPEKVELQVLDMTGQVIATNNDDIDLANFCSGIYLINIVNENRVMKIIR